MKDTSRVHFAAVRVGVGIFLCASVSLGQWTLVWQDEFDGTTLNTSKWTAVTNCGDKRNSEQQCYMASAVSVADGALTITGSKQAQSDFSYTSGAVKTGTKFTQAYGRFEFRAQLPAGGQGVWPALWLYPPNQWPPEIDVLEAVNTMSTIYMTYHWGTASTHQQDGGNASITDPGDWHLYAMEWESGAIRWYIDGTLKRTFSGSNVTDIPMQLYINLALGGSWPGSVGASTVFPQVMRVDYVRVYQRSTEVRPPKPSLRASARGTVAAVYDVRGNRMPSRLLRANGSGVVVIVPDGQRGTVIRGLQ